MFNKFYHEFFNVHELSEWIWFFVYGLCYVSVPLRESEINNDLHHRSKVCYKYLLLTRIFFYHWGKEENDRCFKDTFERFSTCSLKDPIYTICQWTNRWRMDFRCYLLGCWDNMQLIFEYFIFYNHYYEHVTQKLTNSCEFVLSHTNQLFRIICTKMGAKIFKEQCNIDSTVQHRLN